MVITMIGSRRADAQKNFKSITGVAAVVTVEFIWPKIDRKLSAEPDVDVVSMRKITDVAKADRVDGEDFIQIARGKDELVT